MTTMAAINPGAAIECVGRIPEDIPCGGREIYALSSAGDIGKPERENTRTFMKESETLMQVGTQILMGPDGQNEYMPVYILVPAAQSAHGLCDAEKTALSRIVRRVSDCMAADQRASG